MENTNIKKINAFIEKLFQVYDISLEQHFGEIDEEWLEELEELELSADDDLFGDLDSDKLFDNFDIATIRKEAEQLPFLDKPYKYEGDPIPGRIVLLEGNENDDNVLNKVSKLLGVSKNAIVNIDIEECNKWFKKYPYFSLIHKYNALRYKTDYKDDPYTVESLVRAIFGGNEMDFKKYEKELKNRLNQALIELNKYMPGIYHEHAKLNIIDYVSKDVIPFDDMYELLKSFIAMADRHKELFFEAWNRELTDEEVNEYNFLTTVLNATHVLMPSRLLDYESVRKLSPTFKTEHLVDYKSFVIYRGLDFEPWRCKGFLQDPKLAAKYLSYIPRTKAALRTFYMYVKNIRIAFYWSDDKDNSDYLNIPKTVEELGDCEKYVSRLKTWALVPNQFPVLAESDFVYSTERMIKHVAVLGGNHNA